MVCCCCNSNAAAKIFAILRLIGYCIGLEISLGLLIFFIMIFVVFEEDEEFGKIDLLMKVMFMICILVFNFKDTVTKE